MRPSALSGGSIGQKTLLRAAGALFLLLGLLVVEGWLWDAGYIKSLLPGLVSMKPTTALAFIQAGLSVLLYQSARGAAHARRLAKAATAVLWVMSLLTLAEGQWTFAVSILCLTAAACRSMRLLNHWDSAQRRSEALLNERLRAEQAQFQLAAIMNSSEDAIVGATIEGAIFSWNRGATRILGHSLGDVLGRSISLIMPPERVQDSAEIFHSIRRGQRIEGRRTLCVTQDGRRIHVSLTLAPIEDAAGRLIGASATVRDTSERTALEEARCRLAAMEDFTDDAVITESLDGSILGWNRGAQRLYGYSPEEALGQPIAMLVPTERVDEVDEILEQIRRGNRLEHYETTRAGKDGRIHHVSLNVVPIRDPAGTVVGASAIARDITERRQTERALEEAGARLAAAHTEMDRMSRALANDLRAPLQALDGLTRVLLEEHAGALDARGLDCLQQARLACGRMTSLLDAMPSLASTYGGDVLREPVNLSAIVQRIADDLRKTEPGRQLEFVIREGAIVEGDGRLLSIALENLMGNACRSSGKRPRARIEFGVAHGDQAPVFFVRNDRSGAGSEDPPPFGDPWPQPLPDDLVAPGLESLATVQRIIEQHGGRVWAENEAERGATFFFTL